MGLIKKIKNKLIENLIDYLSKEETDEMFEKISKELDKVEPVIDEKYQVFNEIKIRLCATNHFFLLLIKKLEVVEMYEECALLKDYLVNQKYSEEEISSKKEYMWDDMLRLTSHDTYPFLNFGSVMQHDLDYAVSWILERKNKIKDQTTIQ